jgi:lipid-binding SYLF domain-containing protein
LDAISAMKQFPSLASRRRAPRIALASFVAAMLLPQQAFAQAEQRVLVTDAKLALATFINDPDMNWLQRNLGDAKAVLIAPRITKAGFIVGGSGGRAVAFARDPDTGSWAGPAFYTLATASVGFQAGIAVSQVVTLVMTDRGLNSLLSRSFRIGGDASVAAGPVGTGAQSNLAADLISFSRAKGVYGGLNLHGTIVSVSTDWNDLYYGRSVNATDILIRRNVHNGQASELLNMLASATKK